MNFDKNILQALIGGKSPMDLQLSLVKDNDDALQFLNGYGFDLNNPDDEKKLWNYHTRAVSYIKSHLLEDQKNNIPATLADRSHLESLHNLLIHASNKLEKDKNLLRWACAILKVIHVLVHLDNDLFAQFSSDIQIQILKPFNNHIFDDKIGGAVLGDKNSSDIIQLHKFSTKIFKHSDSAVTKLLANPEKVAFTVLDKIGVRFVTKSIFDSFRVLNYLVRNNVIGIFHIIPNQSNNTVYPIQLFTDTINKIKDKNLHPEEIEKLLMDKLDTYSKTIKNDYLIKNNEFTDQNYKFIKFICRKIIHLERNQNKKFNFFYPFEIQIMDYQTYIKNLTGPSSHEEYKKRQKQKARSRILGFVD